MYICVKANAEVSAVPSIYTSACLWPWTKFSLVTTWVQSIRRILPNLYTATEEGRESYTWEDANRLPNTLEIKIDTAKYCTVKIGVTDALDFLRVSYEIKNRNSRLGNFASKASLASSIQYLLNLLPPDAHDFFNCLPQARGLIDVCFQVPQLIHHGYRTN